MPNWTPTSTLAKLVEAAGFHYDPGQDILYSRMDAAQRAFGYAYLYDRSILLIDAVIDCEPIFFHAHGKQWMVELWKGQYSIETGCEIGVYNRPDSPPAHYLLLDRILGTRAHDPGHGLFYQCAEEKDLLTLAFTLKRDGKPLFKRGPERHWWLTGFKWGVFSTPEQLAMDIAVTLPDREMHDAFAGALKAMGYKVKDEGLTVSFTFDRPKTHQPAADMPWEVAEAQKTQRAVVADYETFKLKTNDPNLIPDDLAFRLGSSVLGKSADFLGAMIAEALRGAGRSAAEVIGLIGNFFGQAADAVGQWLANAGYEILECARAIGDFLHDHFTMNFSTAVEIHNRTFGGVIAHDLVLVRYFAVEGYFLTPPPARIPAGRVGRIFMKDKLGPEGSGGVAIYEFIDRAGHRGQIQFGFGCPAPFWLDNVAACSRGDFVVYARSGDGTAWNGQGQVPKAGHPLVAAFVWAGGPAPDVQPPRLRAELYAPATNGAPHAVAALPRNSIFDFGDYEYQGGISQPGGGDGHYEGGVSPRIRDDGTYEGGISRPVDAPRKSLIVVVSDLHISINQPQVWYSPALHNPYLKQVCDWAIQNKEQVREMVLLGDVVDFWTFPAQARPPSFDDILKAQPEIFGPKGFFAQVMDALDGAVTYIPGNHDMAVTAKDVAKIASAGGHKMKFAEGVYYPLGPNDHRVALAHGHYYTIFNAPDAKSPWAPLPVGHFITRMICSKMVADHSVAAEMPNQGSPNGLDFGAIIKGAVMSGQVGITKLLLDSVAAQTRTPPDQAFILADGRTARLDRDIRPAFDNLFTRWIGECGGGVTGALIAAKSALADADVGYMGWFAQRQAFQSNAKVIVLGHTHTPISGLHNSMIGYVNNGFECPSRPDMGAASPKAITFTVIDTTTMRAQLKVSRDPNQTPGRLNIGDFGAPEAKIVEGPFQDYSCYVSVANTGQHALKLERQSASAGYWVAPPPEIIERGQSAGFWLQDYPGGKGAEAEVVYRSGNSARRLKFGCPLGLPNYVGGADFLASVENPSSWQRNDVKWFGHPLYVQYTTA